MIVRRSSLGGYWVGAERWQSVTEVQRELPESSFEYASQNVLLQRFSQFLSDASAGLYPPSFKDALEIWGEKASSVSILKWLASDSGLRWLAASKTIQDNAHKDRGTLLHRFKDALAKDGPFSRDKDVCDWLDAEVSSESELSKMTRGEYEAWLAGERQEDLKFDAWHDRFRHDRPQRAFDCTAEEAAPYLLSLNEWWKDESPECVWVERTLLNPRKKVVGTADGLLVWRGRLFLADFKSTKNCGPKHYHAAQLGGYYGMTHYHDPETKELRPLEWPEGMGLIVFSVTREKVYPYQLKDPKKAVKKFNALLEIVRDTGCFYDYRQTEAMNRKEASA